MSQDELIGKTIRDFTILERIGRGGMAVVYRAHQISMNREVAVKTIRVDDDWEDNANFRARFEREVKVVISLEHMYILPVYAYGIEDNLAFLAMRLLTGGTLEDIVSEKPLPLEHALHLFNQFTKGLAYAHSRGVIHRDLKPSNIMLDNDGNAYLTDFGLAKMIETDHQITKSTSIVGTPLYMSPEQLRGEPLDHRSDIYSLGLLLYRMLTAKSPYLEDENSEMATIVYNHLERKPIPLTEYDPNIPTGIQDVVFKALAKNREDRFQSVGDMIRALRQAVGDIMDSSTEYPLPAGYLQQARRTAAPSSSKSRIRFGTGIVILFAAIALLFFFVLSTLQNNMDYEYGSVLSGITGHAEDVVPTREEIDRARQQFGDDQFIAIMACNQSSEYHTGVTREMFELARAYDIPVKVYDPDSDVYQQITLFERARIENAAAFITCSLDSDATRETLTSLSEANYPIVSDELEKTYGGTALFTGNYEMGYSTGVVAGEYIRDNLDGQARVLIMTLAGNDNIENRQRGLIEGLTSIAPEAEIVGTVRGATLDWGKASVESTIESGIEFNVILSINDAGSFGAVEALEEAGFQPDEISIFSVDAENLAQKYIREGYFFRGSLALNREEFAHTAINTIVKVLAGSDVPEFLTVPPGEVITQATFNATTEE